MSKHTKVGLFIIESTDIDGEQENRREGQLLTEMLLLLEIPVEYVYIRTAQELEFMLKRFATSDYRYLHISCHGDSDSLGLTLDEVPFSELGQVVPSFNGKRRIFLSACSVTSDILAKQLEGTGFFSIIGPKDDVRWDDAAVFWSTFYHRMFSIRRDQMVKKDLVRVLGQLSNLFGLRFSGFFRKRGQFENMEFIPSRDSDFAS